MSLRTSKHRDQTKDPRGILWQKNSQLPGSGSDTGGDCTGLYLARNREVCQGIY